MSTKECDRCRMVKPIRAFRRNSKRPDGYTLWCIECMDHRRPVDVSRYQPANKTVDPFASKPKQGFFSWLKGLFNA